MLKLTSAVVVDGEILKAGTLVELVESEAKALLSRGKAVLAEIEDDLGLGKGDKAGEVDAQKAAANALADALAADLAAAEQAEAEKLAAEKAADEKAQADAAQAAADAAAAEQAGNK
ncbi:MAG TPA: hypothetical protein VGT79_00550 [Xanthomonadaceae bacterium]|nr:hypothetical protein [Xanthomonadaceae bacterium]